MYELFYAPGACSLAIHALLREVGETPELHAVNLQAPRPEALVKVNPRGSVPVLTDNGTAIREGGAILIYLADKHQSPLLPRDGLARAAALEWLMFANSTLHPTYSRSFFLARQMGDKAGENPLYTATIEAIQKLWDEVEAELATKPFIAGAHCTLADILLTVIGNWGAWLKQPLTFGPKTKDLFARVSARPAFQAALKAENVEYKAAA